MSETKTRYPSSIPGAPAYISTITYYEPSLDTNPGYEPLSMVLQEALDQAQNGKGKHRHANGKPFIEQPIMEEGRNSGTGFLSGQARKKILEALNCKDDERAIVDLLGAINYVAAMVLLRRESVGKGADNENG